MAKKTTVLDLQAKKEAGEPIVMLTAYDYPGARLAEQGGVDVILVGDSLAMTTLGHENTVAVTMDEMLHHCKAVARGAKTPFLIGDMPFMSYQTSPTEAVRNAGRFLKEAGMDAVKLEGGAAVIEAVKAISDAGILVMGHLGLLPQSVAKQGGYKAQGRTAAAAETMYRDALALQNAGCFGLVLEAVPPPVAEIITQRLNIPTIGIGAGGGCDGQVMVYHDILGLFEAFTPKFVKRYAELAPAIINAISTYRQEVISGQFPTDAQTFRIDPAELARFREAVDAG